MAYAQPADMLIRYDSRTIGDLVGDDNVRQSATELLTDPVLATLLVEASGDIELALLVGGFYTPVQLQNLPTNSKATLTGMCCVITLAKLRRRRPGKDPKAYKADTEAADAMLDLLKEGSNVFNISSAIAAQQPVATGPTTLQTQQLHMIRDRAGTRYYPRRWMPADGGG